MTPLYSIRSTIGAEGQLAYRITKFVDGEVESSYLLNQSGTLCECPAGTRPTCRHRKMLPIMLASDILNTHWFLDYDASGEVVDFEGVPRSLYELGVAAGLATGSEAEFADRQTFTIPEGYEAILDAEGRTTGEIRPIPEGPVQIRTRLPPASWRRI